MATFKTATSSSISRRFAGGVCAHEGNDAAPVSTAWIARSGIVPESQTDVVVRLRRRLAIVVITGQNYIFPSDDQGDSSCVKSSERWSSEFQISLFWDFQVLTLTRTIGYIYWNAPLPKLFYSRPPDIFSLP